MLATRHLTAAIAIPTTAAALGTKITSSDFEITPETVFSGKTTSTSAAKATFNLNYQRTGYSYSGLYSTRVTVGTSGTQPWDIQITSVNLNLEAGKAYQVWPGVAVVSGVSATAERSLQPQMLGCWLLSRQIYNAVTAMQSAIRSLCMHHMVDCS